MKICHYNKALNHIQNFRKFKLQNFCVKYIPLRKLKLEDIGYIEPAGKIYSNKLADIQFKIRTNKSISYFLASTLLLSTGLFYFPVYYSVVANLFLQPFLFIKRALLHKENTQLVESVYLLKNGHQIVIITFSEAVHIINIKDILKYEENENLDKIFIQTSERNFVVELGNKSWLNEDLFNAIKMHRIVNTNFGYGSYNRFTVQK
jgi:hypothetical protein